MNLDCNYGGGADDFKIKYDFKHYDEIEITVKNTRLVRMMKSSWGNKRKIKSDDPTAQILYSYLESGFYIRVKFNDYERDLENECFNKEIKLIIHSFRFGNYWSNAENFIIENKVVLNALLKRINDF